MGLFDIFKKKDEQPKLSKGFHLLETEVIHLNEDAVKIIFSVPSELSSIYKTFVPGQYVNIEVSINGEKHRRSYSICSGKNEPLAIAVKAIDKGTVSVWCNRALKTGDKIAVSQPEGSFCLANEHQNVVAIAAGSGITPILSIAKEIEKNGHHLTLFYGNRTKSSALFLDELSSLKSVQQHLYFSGESVENATNGRIDKENFTQAIKSNLSLLRADAFFICGPEQMILDCKEILRYFGVQDSKIHFELFTAPSHEAKDEPASNFEGTSHVKVILDGEVTAMDIKVPGATILESVDKIGLDAPYSCRGGVCSSCKAKVTEGIVQMRYNYSLTDEEVKKGYILTCQAIPQSENVTIDFDA